MDKKNIFNITKKNECSGKLIKRGSKISSCKYLGDERRKTIAFELVRELYDGTNNNMGGIPRKRNEKDKKLSEIGFSKEYAKHVKGNLKENEHIKAFECGRAMYNIYRNSKTQCAGYRGLYVKGDHIKQLEDVKKRGRKPKNVSSKEEEDVNAKSLQEDALNPMYFSFNK